MKIIYKSSILFLILFSPLLKAQDKLTLIDGNSLTGTVLKQTKDTCYFASRKQNIPTLNVLAKPLIETIELSEIPGIQNSLYLSSSQYLTNVNCYILMDNTRLFEGKILSDNSVDLTFETKLTSEKPIQEIKIPIARITAIKYLQPKSSFENPTIFIINKDAKVVLKDKRKFNCMIIEYDSTKINVYQNIANVPKKFDIPTNKISSVEYKENDVIAFNKLENISTPQGQELSNIDLITNKSVTLEMVSGAKLDGIIYEVNDIDVKFLKSNAKDTTFLSKRNIKSAKYTNDAVSNSNKITEDSEIKSSNSKPVSKNTFGVGFQYDFPAWGFSAMVDVSNHFALQGIIGALTTERHYILRPIIRFKRNEYYNFYSFANLGIWSDEITRIDESTTERESTFGYGIGLGFENDSRGWSSSPNKWPPLFWNFTLSYSKVDFDNEYEGISLDDYSGLYIGVGLHYKF